MANFSTLIQSWFRQNCRNLPWRGILDPYKIWLSEIILQQTRVDQGMAYYLKFVDHFPTVNDLAKADEDTVLNLWQGLGYYSRARNMHFSAKKIVDEYNGEFPTTYKEVLGLKGVGSYTAAAITSIAYNAPHAVVDGNVFRVLSRYLKISTPIDTTTGKKTFEQAAAELLDEKNPGNHNQAIMELGALVCTPKVPKCGTCPVHESCGAYNEGNPLDFPVKAKKLKVTQRYFNYLVVTDGQHVLIKKRTGKGIWQGLYDFPLVETEKERQDLDSSSLNRFEVDDYTLDGTFTHILSHQKIFASFWLIRTGNVTEDDNEIKIKIDALEDYPLPQLLIRYIQGSTLIKTD